VVNVEQEYLSLVEAIIKRAIKDLKSKGVWCKTSAQIFIRSDNARDMIESLNMDYDFMINKMEKDGVLNGNKEKRRKQ